MEKLLVTLDEESAKVLKGKINKSAVVREALKIYNENISTGTVAGMTAAFTTVNNNVKDIKDKVDYIYSISQQGNGELAYDKAADQRPKGW